MHKKTWQVIWLVGALLVAACGGSDPDDGKEPGDNPPPGNTDRPGLGRSTAPPEGTPFALPAGVTLAAPLKGFSIFEPELCAPREGDLEEPKGSGDLVQLCFTLRNTTDTTSSPIPIVIELPAGLVVESEKLSTQNGILIQRQVVTVQPGQTIYLPLFFFCLNDTRSPSTPSDTFKLGPVLQYTDFKELFELLEDKNLDPTGQVELQAAVWNLSNGKKLTDDDRAAISNL